MNNYQNTVMRPSDGASDLAKNSRHIARLLIQLILKCFISAPLFHCILWNYFNHKIKQNYTSITKRNT